MGKSDPTMVELGVLNGELTFGLFDRGWTDAHFVLVDPWQPHPSRTSTRAEQRRCDAMHSGVGLGAYGRNEANFEILRMDAVEALQFCSPESADLVYIDFFYNKPIYAKTLRAWWDVVRPGGVFAGHDFARYPEIEAAVRAFSKEIGVHIQCLPDSTSRARLDQLHKDPTAWQCQMWCLCKPKKPVTATVAGQETEDAEEDQDSAEADEL